MTNGTLAEGQARHFAQSFVILVQAALLLGAAVTERSVGARAAAESFCATRLNREAGWGAVFGASDARVDSGALLSRAFEG